MAKAYVAVFYCDIGGYPPTVAHQIIESVKETFRFHDLEDCLNAQVLPLLIRITQGPSRLEVLEFFVDEETKPHSKDNYDITGKTPNEIAQILTKVLKEKQ